MVLSAVYGGHQASRSEELTYVQYFTETSGVCLIILYINMTVCDLIYIFFFTLVLMIWHCTDLYVCYYMCIPIVLKTNKIKLLTVGRFCNQNEEIQENFQNEDEMYMYLEISKDYRLSTCPNKPRIQYSNFCE